jgi:hypothetical protein
MEVGAKDPLVWRTPLPQTLTFEKQFLKAPWKVVRIGGKACIDRFTFPSLPWCHTTATSETNIRHRIEILRVGSDEDVEVIRVELGNGEALKTIGNKIFRERDRLGEDGVGGETLAAEEHDAV